MQCVQSAEPHIKRVDPCNLLFESRHQRSDGIGTIQESERLNGDVQKLRWVQLDSRQMPQRILHLEKGQLVEDAPREGTAAGARDGSTAIMAVNEESTTFPSR